jgi:hypothetical protein
MRNSIASAICIAATLATSSMAHAACNTKEPVFSCTTTKGKYVEVCDADKVIQYSFGKKGEKPEMALSIPRAEATTYQWSGFGRNMTYSVQIPNSGTVYEVFSSTDKMSDEHARTSGINVLVGEKLVASLACKDATVVNNIEGISLKPAPWQ